MKRLIILVIIQIIFGSFSFSETVTVTYNDRNLFGKIKTYTKPDEIYIGTHSNHLFLEKRHSFGSYSYSIIACEKIITIINENNENILMDCSQNTISNEDAVNYYQLADLVIPIEKQDVISNHLELAGKHLKYFTYQYYAGIGITSIGIIIKGEEEDLRYGMIAVGSLVSLTSFLHIRRAGGELVKANAEIKRNE